MRVGRENELLYIPSAQDKQTCDKQNGNNGTSIARMKGQGSQR